MSVGKQIPTCGCGHVAESDAALEAHLEAVHDDPRESEVMRAWRGRRALRVVAVEPDREHHPEACARRVRTVRAGARVEARPITVPRLPVHAHPHRAGGMDMSRPRIMTRVAARDCVVEDEPLELRRDSRTWQTTAEVTGLAAASLLVIGLAALLGGA